MRHLLRFFLPLTLAASAAEPRLLDPRDAKGPTVIWSTALGYTGTMTVAGDAILVGSNDNGASIDAMEAKNWTHVVKLRTRLLQNTECAMVCLDARTGALRWRSVHPGVTNRHMGIPGYAITSKPWVEANRAYFLTTGWELVCCDMAGFHDGKNDGPFTEETAKGETDADIIWKLDLRKDLGVTPCGAGDVSYVQSAPVVMGDLVYVVTGHGPNSDGTIADAPSFIAVDKMTGRVAWTSNAPGKNIAQFQGGSPVALPDAGEIVFPGGDGCLYGFDAKSGKQHWKSDFNALGGTKGLYFETQPLVAGGALIASLRLYVERGPQRGAPLIAIAPGASPKVKWIFGKDLNGFWPQMLLQDGVVYASSARNILHALDPGTGAERWRLPLGHDGVGGAGLQIGGGKGKLYVTNEDGDFFIVRPGDKPALLATFNLQEMPAEYGRATLCKHGLCVPTREGVLMLRLP